MDNKKDILWRIYLVYIGVCIVALVILGKVIHIQFMEGDNWKAISNKLTLAYTNIEATRGNILASDGNLLATSIPVYDVYFDPNTDYITDDLFYQNVDSLAINLSGLFKDKSTKEYKKILRKARKTGNRYLLLQRKVPHKDLRLLKTFPIFRFGKNKGGLVCILNTKERKLLYGILAGRTIGILRENRPVGLEASYDSLLKGYSGKRLMKQIAINVWMPINDDNEIEPKNGNDVVTTLDINLQDVAEKALLDQLTLHNASHGCVILMEVSTGDIKAIANLSKKNKDSDYNENYNFAIGESIEPGSTFKLASMVVAMEDGYVKLDDLVNTGDGKTTYFNQKMEDSHKGGYGTITAKHAFEVSSNVGISKLIYKHYGSNPEKFISHLYKMGLNKPLNIDVPGEGHPEIKDPKDPLWSAPSLPWMSIGYELKMTPLQVLTFYNAIANNGKMVKPRFVKEIRDAGKLKKVIPITVINPAICSPKTVAMARELLEGVVENGTGKNLKGFHIKIAGKTGTAQIAKGNKGYGNDENNRDVSYRASFVGYFPADNPKYSCIVVVNAPSSDVYYGSLVAGPIFKEIADKVYSNRIDFENTSDSLKASSMPYVKAGSQKTLNEIFKYLNISCDVTDTRWIAPTYKDSVMSLSRRIIVPNLVPNVIGMGARDAVFLLESKGIRTSLKGKGMVKKQSVEAGTKIVKGMIIKLELNS